MTTRYNGSVNSYLESGTRDAILMDYAKIEEILPQTKQVVLDIDTLCIKLDKNLCTIQDSSNAPKLEEIKENSNTVLRSIQNSSNAPKLEEIKESSNIALRSIILLQRTVKRTTFVMPEIKEKATKAKDSTATLFHRMSKLQINIFHLKPNTNKTEICTISTEIKEIANKVADEWNIVLGKVEEIKKRAPEFKVGTSGPNPFGGISTRRERYNPRPGGGSRHRRKRTHRKRTRRNRNRKRTRCNRNRRRTHRK